MNNLKLKELIATSISSFTKSEAIIDELSLRWSESHRKWHNYQHLAELISTFQKESRRDERETLLLSAVYHDIVYDPTKSDCEEQSEVILRRHIASVGVDTNKYKKVFEIIKASKWRHTIQDSLTYKFWKADCSQFDKDYPLSRSIEYELAIFSEYQFHSLAAYKEGRVKFLRKWSSIYPEFSEKVNVHLDLLKGLKPKVAIYPGSFNPFHRGHLSILRQAEKLFDKVIIGVAINRQKSESLESLYNSLYEKRRALQKLLCFHEVVEIPRLLTEFTDSYPLPLPIIRGIRNGSDLESELKFSKFINDLSPKTNVLWIGCNSESQHISSSAIRELNSIDESVGGRYIPDTFNIYNLIK